MMELHEVVAVIDPENLGSQHVLKNCGMRLVGRKRADDVEWLKMARDAWNAQVSNS